MSQTLGEKLRLAREERGISITEVAEQTRISPHYLQSIDDDDYRTLPGGIFNKGFVKSYAKYVGVDEHEALADYASLISANDKEADPDEPKQYRPEVLTDDRSSGSMIPTIIVAVVILGIMTVGILYAIRYLNEPGSPPAANATANNSNQANPPQPPTAASSTVPAMTSLKVEFKALSVPVSLTAINDGKLSSSVVTAGSTTVFEPKESLKLSYSRSLASVVQLTVNGKAITLPAVPINPKRAAIEFEINRENIGQIWNDGAIATDVPSAVANTNAAAAGPTPISVVSPPRPTPVAKPSVAVNKPSAANNGTKPLDPPKPGAADTKPGPTKPQ